MLGWNPSQPITKWTTSISLFDGDNPQIQNMLFEAHEELDNAECIIRNKHLASSMGTQQPCDLSPVFRLLKVLQTRTTSWNDTTVGLAETVHDLFEFQLRAGGLNLDSNPLKKKDSIDFLCCLPKMAEKTMPKKNSIAPFVEAGITNDETNIFPIFDYLAGTCKRWVSISKNIGISRVLKQHCNDQFTSLASFQLDEGQVTYPDMHSVGIPKDKHYLVSCLC